jgi:uncharacterized protein (DUF2344 family)
MLNAGPASAKTTRIRLIYEKRGRACFVPHVAMSTIFARAAKRAGIELSNTDGFSPRAKISFGPELPAGVVALNEPADLWLKSEEIGTKNAFFSGKNTFFRNSRLRV